MDYKSLKAELLTKSTEELQEITARTRYTESDFNRVSNGGTGWVSERTNSAAQAELHSMWKWNNERFLAHEILLNS